MADSGVSKTLAFTGVRVRVPPRASQGHLRAAAAAGRSALGHRLLRLAERLGEPAAERARRLARGAAAHARGALGAVLRVAREAREQEPEDEQDDAERDDATDDHALALPGGRVDQARRGASAAASAGGATSTPGAEGPTGASGRTSSPARSQISAPAARSHAFRPCS